MLTESSVNDLYQSAVAAFPGTTKRQHAIDPVRIVQLSWTPYVGLNTLFIKGLAENAGRNYKTLALFKNVTYGSGLPVVVNDKEYLIEPISAENTDVVVRCDCKDFYWRFNYYDHLDHSLYGRKRSQYEGKGLWKANPMEMAGMCKHLMKMFLALRDAQILN